MALKELHEQSFSRECAYMLKDKGMNDDYIKELGYRDGWTVKELIEQLQEMPENDLVSIGEDPTKEMSPRFFPMRYNFKDENREEGFMLIVSRRA